MKSRQLEIPNAEGTAQRRKVLSAYWWPRCVRHVAPAYNFLWKLAGQQDAKYLSCEFKFGNILHHMSASNIASCHDIAEFLSVNSRFSFKF